MIFNCTWDYSIKQETCITGIILLICVILIIWKLRQEIKKKSYWKSSFLSVTIIFLLYITLSSILNTPKEIELTKEYLSINSQLTSKQIDYSVIKDIRLVKEEDLLRETRTFGSSGLGADQGRWKSEKLGYYQKYTTNPKNQIWVETTDSKNIIFSCDNPEQLIDVVKTKLK